MKKEFLKTQSCNVSSHSRKREIIILDNWQTGDDWNHLPGKSQEAVSHHGRTPEWDLEMQNLQWRRELKAGLTAVKQRNWSPGYPTSPRLPSLVGIPALPSSRGYKHWTNWLWTQSFRRWNRHTMKIIAFPLRCDAPLNPGRSSLLIRPGLVHFLGLLDSCISSNLTSYLERSAKMTNPKLAWPRERLRKSQKAEIELAIPLPC